MFSLSNSDENLSIKNESLSTGHSPRESLNGHEESKDGVSGMDGKRYALRWRHHQSTVVAEVGCLYRDAALVDVTLACEDQRTYQAHKLVLSACSQYFQGLFSRHPAHQHPIIFLKDVSGDECEALLTYMYRGEVSVNQDQIPRILRVASSLQVRGLAEVESQSSRPSSPAYGDRSAHCGSSSPSPSTGPPTKCPSPISEPHSPNPPPPLINPHIQNINSVAQSLASQEPPAPPPPRHLSSLAGALVGGSGVPHHPSLSQDFPSYHFPHNRHPYDISPSSLLGGSLSDERKRHEDKGPPPPPLSAPYAPPQLRVKQDLGGNSWEGGGDVGGLSPLSLTDGPRTPFMPHTIFSSFLNSQEPHVPSPSQAYGRLFPISDPLRRVDRLCPSGGETRIHKCHYCSRKFKRKDHLKTHVRIHTGERPYKCKICGRGFIQSQQVKIHMKVHIREDSSGHGGSSVLSGVGSADRTLSALYPELASHYGDSHMNDRSLRHSRNSQDNSNPDGNVSPSDHHSSLHHPGPRSMDNADSDNDYGSEIMEAEFESMKDRTTPPHISSGGGGGRFHPASTSSFVPSNSSNPPSPTPVNTNHSGHRSTTPISQSLPPLTTSSPLEDRTCSAIAMKESYHIATNLKK